MDTGGFGGLTESQRPPFPTETLPPRLRAFAEAVSVQTQTPTALSSLLLLAILATATAKRLVVRVRPGWSEPTNLYIVVALPPGNRKSGVFAAVVEPVEEVEAEELRKSEAAISSARNRQKVAEAALARTHQEAGRATGADQAARLAEADRLAQELATMRVPAVPRRLADDVTPEVLATLLATQGGRIAVLSAEGGLFEGTSRYSANAAPNIDVLLKAHAGDALRVDRVGRPPEFVRAPALTLGLATQPEVIRGLIAKPGFHGRGLQARILFAVPESLVGRRATKTPPVPSEVREAWRHVVRTLLNLPITVDGDGEPAPHVLSLSPGATALFEAFEEALEPRLGEFGDLALVTEWASKLAGVVARIAGLLHAAERVDQGPFWTEPIAEGTMAGAIRIAQEFLVPHALAAFAEMGADPAVADARYIRRWIAAHGVGSFTKRELFQATKGRFRQVRAMEPAIAVLLEHGHLVERPAPDHPGPGRKPSPVFEVLGTEGSQNAHYSHNQGPNSRGRDG